MTMSQNTGVVVNGNFSAQHIYNNTAVNDGLNVKIGGNGTAYYRPKFTDTRVMANSSILDDANANVGIGGSLDVYFKLRNTVDVYVDDSTVGHGIVFIKQPRQLSAHLTPDEYFYISTQTIYWQMGFVYGIKRVVLSLSRDGLQYWSRVYWRKIGRASCRERVYSGV